MVMNSLLHNKSICGASVCGEMENCMKKNYLRKLMCVIFILAISILTGCGDDSEDIYDSELGIDMSSGQITKSIDTHGSLGEGSTYIQVEFYGEDADTLENELKENDIWRKLPLSNNLRIAVYGDKNNMSLAQSFDEGIPAIPEISHGYYFFKDRHSDSLDSSDDLYLFSRYSFNFDILLFDSDEHIMYIFQFDT